MTDRRLVVDVDRVATGGAGLGSGPDGRVVFVDGAIPGERVSVTVTGEWSRRLEAVVDEVIEASSDRIEPSCLHVERGCGGCDWQHVAPDRQPALRRDVVADCLRRLARIEPGASVLSGPALPPFGYRTTVRLAVSRGRPGYRRRSSHDVVTVDDCPVANQLINRILAESDFGSADEITIRVGSATGEAMVIVEPNTEGITVPDGVIVIGADELRAGRTAHVHEVIGGTRFRISAGSFFQCRPDGAEVLARIVGDVLADVEGTMLDAYCGVGLFGALCGGGRRVIGVESNPTAGADAVANLGPEASIIHSRFERWQPEPVAVAVADPARTGLRAAGVDRLAATGAEVLALVSCDPASLARDARLLIDAGYNLDTVTVVDLFGNTSHVETVSRFHRR